jgi:hypothetical protein
MHVRMRTVQRMTIADDTTERQCLHLHVRRCVCVCVCVVVVVVGGGGG